WAERTARRGGPNNAQTCGALLVRFGASAADDWVLVGTGETSPRQSPTVGKWGGYGVLAAHAPTQQPLGAPTWEDESGLDLMEGLGVFALACSPSSTPGATSGAGLDKVLAATSAGLYVGTRTAGAPDSYHWAKA